MGEYLYIATNASMPGLLKIGRTTKSPGDRMAELHTTGVPTPFELQFVAIVADSVSAERLAHGALSECRVSQTREFFGCGIVEALKRIIPVIGAHAIDWEHTTVRQSGVEEIERQFLAQEERVRAARQAEQRRIKSELFARGRVIKAELQCIDLQLTAAEKTLHRLGPRPQSTQWGCWSSIVTAAFVALIATPATLWIATLLSTEHKKNIFVFMSVILGCVVALFIYTSSHGNFEKKIGPWRNLDDETNRLGLRALPLRAELEQVRKSVAALPPTGP